MDVSAAAGVASGALGAAAEAEGVEEGRAGGMDTTEDMSGKESTAGCFGGGGTGSFFGATLSFLGGGRRTSNVSVSGSVGSSRLLGLLLGPAGVLAIAAVGIEEVADPVGPFDCSLGAGRVIGPGGRLGFTVADTCVALVEAVGIGLDLGGAGVGAGDGFFGAAEGVGFEGSERVGGSGAVVCGLAFTVVAGRWACLGGGLDSGISPSLSSSSCR